ncbi:hypothetical protein CLAFUW4_01625 [Fulvia fulva]|uniref:Apple domain-containing protein n=1 Tax=Passalora fulva TaxID=5499 RepID=A0A9Q8L7G6_PASFU|nr:uncharacterized protein CLAFUR5_01624 [Fulvia fulva]KAK4635723.1 hypothetical protein CLAFUR4_01623 [Fulvia fulva]UJO11588.1 hypothetical protein CLAFUR5_01624 [Fulvia fulva]WPV08245.1 hypothetical protein CLAFUW4_01625 [Fulvia fulva]WPV23830.1 hypothetical protein CLAFUW7_01627 [Fulvia fulva]
MAQWCFEYLSTYRWRNSPRMLYPASRHDRSSNKGCKCRIPPACAKDDWNADRVVVVVLARTSGYARSVCLYPPYFLLLFCGSSKLDFAWLSPIFLSRVSVNRWERMVRFSADVCSIAGIALTLLTIGSAQTSDPDAGTAYSAVCPATLGEEAVLLTVTDECGVEYSVRCDYGKSPGTDLVDNYADTFNGCFEQCSAYAGGVCIGFDYMTTTKRCYLKEGTTGPIEEGSEAVAVIGAVIVDRPTGTMTCVETPEANIPIAYPSATPTCPANTNTIYTDSEGVSYRIRCQTGVAGGDLGLQLPGISFDQCMVACDNYTPSGSCVAVQFSEVDPDSGLGDCQPKSNAYTGMAGGGLTDAFAFKDTARVVAPAPSPPTYPAAESFQCTGSEAIGYDQTVEDTNEILYSVRCANGRPATAENTENLPTPHGVFDESTLNDCFTECTARDACIGFTYDMDANTCYLKRHLDPGATSGLETGSSDDPNVGAVKIVDSPSGTSSSSSSVTLTSTVYPTLTSTDISSSDTTSSTSSSATPTSTSLGDAETMTCSDDIMEDQTVVDDAGAEYVVRCRYGEHGGTPVDLPNGSGVINEIGDFHLCFPECSARVECTSFTYNYEYRTCYLKNGDNGELATGTDGIDAIGAVRIRPPTSYPTTSASTSLSSTSSPSSTDTTASSYTITSTDSSSTDEATSISTTTVLDTSSSSSTTTMSISTSSTASSSSLSEFSDSESFTSTESSSSTTTLFYSVTRTAPTSPPTATAQTYCPDSSDQLEEACTEAGGDELGASLCSVLDSNSLYAINCGFTGVGNEVRDAAPLANVDSDRPQDFGYCQATCEANKPQCVAVNFVPIADDNTGAGTCTLLSTILGYSYAPGAYSAETVETPPNPDPSETVSTTATTSSASTSSSDYTETNDASSTTDVSSIASISSTSDAGYIPGGPSQPATDTSTAATSSTSNAGYLPGGPSQPPSASTDTSMGASTSSTSDLPYLPGGSSQAAITSTTTSSASNGGYYPGEPSQPGSISTSLATGSLDATSSSEGGYLPTPSQPPNGESSTASSQGAPSQSTYVPGDGDDSVTGSVTSSQPGTGASQSAYVPGGDSSVPASASTSSLQTSGGPSPPPYTGTPTTAYVFPTNIYPATLPSVSVCPGQDDQEFTAPVPGAGTYLVDCGASYAGVQINQPAPYYRRQESTPSQAYCMAVCDYIADCEGVNITPTECEYFSSVQLTYENRPGVIALLKTAPGTNIGPGPYDPGNMGSNASSSSSSFSSATVPPDGYPGGNTGSSTTSSAPQNTNTYPGQGISGSSSPSAPPNTNTYLGISGTPSSTPVSGSISGSVSGSGSGVPPTSTPTGTGTVPVITVTVTSCSAIRTTTVFTTDTITTCALDGSSCPSPAGY